MKPVPRSRTANAAVAYIRNSYKTERKVLSPKMQRSTVLRLAEQHGAQLPDANIFEEAEGTHSAYKRSNLKAFDALLEKLYSDSSIKYLFTYDSARGVRRLEFWIGFVNDLDRAGIEWITPSGLISRVEEGNRMRSQMQAWMDEEESLRASRRQRDTHKKMKEAGVYNGRQAPFGLRRVGKAFADLHFEARPELKVAVEFLKLYIQDHGLPGIASILSERGHFPKPEARKWEHRFSRVLKNLKWYEGLIDANLLQQVRREYEQRKKSHSLTKHHKHATPLLWQLISCGTCGAHLTSTACEWNGHTYWNYAHRRIPCAQPAYISFRKAHAQLFAYLDRLKVVPEELLEQWASARTEPAPPDHARVQAELEKLEKELYNWKVLTAQGELDLESFRQRKAEIEAQRVSLCKELEDVPAPRFNQAERVELLRFLLEEFQPLAEAAPQQANRVLRDIFERVTVGADRQLRFEPSPEFEFLNRT